MQTFTISVNGKNGGTVKNVSRAVFFRQLENAKCAAKEWDKREFPSMGIIWWSVATENFVFDFIMEDKEF